MDSKIVKDLTLQGQAARTASKILARATSERKNEALNILSTALIKRQDEVLESNKKDCTAAEKKGLDAHMLDRLSLNAQRLQMIANDITDVAALPDPVGEMSDMRTLANGLLVGKKRIPLGVIGVIYESRPNVTVDVSSLCIKSGNTCILRGGSEASNSNKSLISIIQESVHDAGIPKEAVQFVDDPHREAIESMVSMDKYIDLLIPRGGAQLIKFISEKATMPVATGGIGVCHTYVDGKADLQKAVDIVYNAKVQRPTVCNALDTLLVHIDVAATYLPLIANQFNQAGVEMRCDQRALAYLNDFNQHSIKSASQDDWGKEFLSLTAAIKVVDTIEEAVLHIETYGDGHSEAIVTDDYGNAMKFLEEVDASAVFVNASTRFNDGAQLGLGAEVAISTQKLHARGPMGLRELTSYKWIIMGNGQIRK